MKKQFISLACLLLLLAAPVLALNVPPLGNRRVNDLAGIMTGGEQNRLEGFLAAYERETGHQMALLILDSLEGEDIQQYAVKVFETWKLGRKGKDDGILLLLGMKEQSGRQVRIEAGYGLEQYITDAVAGDIIRSQLAPAFRQGLYFQGLYQTFGMMMAYINKGEGRNTNIPGLETRWGERGRTGDFSALRIIISLIVFFFVMLGRSSQYNRRWRRRGYTEGPWFTGGFFGGGFPDKGSGGFFGGGGFSGGGGRSGGGGATGGW